MHIVNLRFYCWSYLVKNFNFLFKKFQIKIDFNPYVTYFRRVKVINAFSEWKSNRTKSSG